LAPVAVKVTFGVTVKAVLTLFVPSDTTMVSAPPGRAGTFVDTWNAPEAAVVKQPPKTRLSTAGDKVLIPLFANEVNPAAVQAAPESHGTVVEPTTVVIAMGFAVRNPLPVMISVDPTVPDVAAAKTPLVNVDRVTVGVAACALLSGSRKTIPVIPARNNSPIVPKEASLLFGVICVCILFTIFVRFTL